MTITITNATITICQPDGMCTENNRAAIPALTAPPRLYMPWQVLISSLLYFFSIRFTVALAETPFKKLMAPKKYKHVQNINRFTELIWSIMMQDKIIYPENIHLPTGILLNTLVDNNIPVMAPNGESSNERPRLPSVKPSLDFMPGIEATQMPNKRLEVEKRKPTAKAGLFLIKETKLLIIIQWKMEVANLR